MRSHSYAKTESTSKDESANTRLKTSSFKKDCIRTDIPTIYIGPLIIIVLGTVVSYASRFDAPIVGALPSVYPLPTSPNLQFVRLLLPGSALVAFVGLIGVGRVCLAMLVDVV
jgi:hypothetical protein